MTTLTPVTTLRVFAAVCAALGVVPLANLLTGGRAVPWWGLAADEWTTRGLVVVALATGLAIVLGHRVDAGLDRARALLLRPTPRGFALAAAAVTFAGAAFVSQLCFAGQPFTGDEMAQQWHARVLLSGHLSARPEAYLEFFNTAPVLDHNGRWLSQYPVGGPAFIALGLAIGAAWLVNPVLIAVATWSLHAFLARAFDELTARLTTLLFALSPMVLIMAGSQMNHVPALALTLLALAALARWDETEDRSRQAGQAAAAGLALGIVALVRPLDAAVVWAVVTGFQAWRARRAPERWLSVGAGLLVVAIPVALLLWVNARTTGSALLFGYEALNGPAHAIGFHVDPNGEPHTPLRGLTLVSGYLMRLNRYLFEWPLPGMLAVVAGLLAVGRPSRWDVFLTALAAGFLGAYAAYWFDGFFAGPRFLFTALPVFVYFAARAPRAAAAARQPIVRRAAALLVPLCVVAAWIGPLGVSSARARIALLVDQRTKLKTDIEAQIARAGLRHALVFVNEGWRGRLLARLRVLGITQFPAGRVLESVDACALQTALDAEDSLPARDPGGRAERVLRRARAFGAARPQPDLPADQAIALVPGSTPTATCLREFSYDTSGTMPYPLFLARQVVGRDGRVGGDVVFARDLAGRNELLRDRFGGRSWYRYRPARALDDTSAVFVPYGDPR